MSIFDTLYNLFGFVIVKDIFDKDSRPSAPDGLHVCPGSKGQVMPEGDDWRYDELRNRLEYLEACIEDYEDTDLEATLGKVSALLDRGCLSDENLDLAERALDSIEERIDGYDPDMECDTDYDDIDDYDEIDEELDEALDDDCDEF